MIENQALKTNVTRFLDSKKISYKVFILPEEKLGAVKTAKILNIPIGNVYKTIVAVRQTPGKPVLAVIPGDHQLNLKLLAEYLKEKKMILPTENEAEKLTGLQAGGISPLALINKGFQVVLDISARDKEKIHISGGRRGLNLQLNPNDLAVLTAARFAAISLLLDREAG
ncbi:MAG TPA: YbaK/EbsC family protein [Anaerolineales bacterium]|nr:YbaK/EbsC family protein [Anaerolineales bacterium]